MNATVVSKSTVCSHVSELAVTIHGCGVTVGRCLADSMIMTRGVGTLRCHKGVTSFPSCTTRARARKGTKVRRNIRLRPFYTVYQTDFVGTRKRNHLSDWCNARHDRSWDHYTQQCLDRSLLLSNLDLKQHFPFYSRMFDRTLNLILL